jgi:outer membrane protein OmpA-like peptidoglycan-associated protein
MNDIRVYRNLFFVLFSISVCSTLPAQIRLAAVGGIHSSNLPETNSIPGYQNSTGKYYSSNTGFELGVLGEIPFGKYNLFIQPGIFYSAKGNQFQRFFDSAIEKNDTIYDQHTLNLNYVEIPLYLTWKASLSKNQKNHFFVSAGPYFAFIYSVSKRYQNRVLQYNSSNYVYQSGTEDPLVGNGPGSYKTFDIGIAAKAGFELGSVMISAYFNRGFTNVYNASYPSGFHNQVAGGSLAIWLNKPRPLPKADGDTDKDGLADSQDSCKTIPGPPKWHGCPIPDSDLDGLNDDEDSCRMVPGTLRYHGCPIPDFDNDGVNDEEDSCRTVPGSKNYHGCPIPDSDHDGLNDELDKCPFESGPADNQGCPIVKAGIVKIEQIVAANVMFRSNSASLTKNSYPAIKELADSMKTNPDLDLLIEGHTDNQGDEVYNRKLSEDRAKAVKTLLVGFGIPDNRIEVRAFGDSQPIEPNNSSAGRALNRRVVFKFHLKNS